MPVYHKLEEGTDGKHIIPFIISRMREELEAVTKPPFSLQLSNVALIWDSKYYFNKHKGRMTTFLHDEFHTTPQTIEEQLTTNDMSGIIIDHEENIMSFESPVVVFIRTGSGIGTRSFYTSSTRARVSFTIVDVRTGLPPHTYNNMDSVHWKPHHSNNGTFVKYTP